MHHGWRYRMLGGMFLTSKDTAKKVKWRIHLFLIMKDPIHSLTTYLNSNNLTDDQVKY